MAQTASLGDSHVRGIPYSVSVDGSTDDCNSFKRDRSPSVIHRYMTIEGKVRVGVRVSVGVRIRVRVRVSVREQRLTRGRLLVAGHGRRPTASTGILFSRAMMAATRH